MQRSLDIHAEMGHVGRCDKPVMDAIRGTHRSLCGSRLSCVVWHAFRSPLWRRGHPRPPRPGASAMSDRYGRIRRPRRRRTGAPRGGAGRHAAGRPRAAGAPHRTGGRRTRQKEQKKHAANRKAQIPPPAPAPEAAPARGGSPPGARPPQIRGQAPGGRTQKAGSPGRRPAPRGAAPAPPAGGRPGRGAAARAPAGRGRRTPNGGVTSGGIRAGRGGGPGRGGPNAGAVRRTIRRGVGRGGGRRPGPYAGEPPRGDARGRGAWPAAGRMAPRRAPAGTRESGRPPVTALQTAMPAGPPVSGGRPAAGGAMIMHVGPSRAFPLFSAGTEHAPRPHGAPQAGGGLRIPWHRGRRPGPCGTVRDPCACHAERPGGAPAGPPPHRNTAPDNAADCTGRRRPAPPRQMAACRGARPGTPEGARRSPPRDPRGRVRPGRPAGMRNAAGPRAPHPAGAATECAGPRYARRLRGRPGSRGGGPGGCAARPRPAGRIRPRAGGRAGPDPPRCGILRIWRGIRRTVPYMRRRVRARRGIRRARTPATASAPGGRRRAGGGAAGGPHPPHPGCRPRRGGPRARQHAVWPDRRGKARMVYGPKCQADPFRTCGCMVPGPPGRSLAGGGLGMVRPGRT